MLSILAALFIAPIALAKNDLLPSEPVQLSLFSPETIKNVCAKNLEVALSDTVSWKGSLNELMGDDEGAFFARLSYVNSAAKDLARASGFNLEVDPRGFLNIARETKAPFS